MIPKTKTPFFNRLQGVAMVAALVWYGAGMVYLAYYLTVAPEQTELSGFAAVSLHWPFLLFAAMAMFFTWLTFYAQRRNKYYARHE
jgi:hypothetical protein